MIYQFGSGMTAMGYLIAILFFLKFWKRSGDPLFLLFSFAFGVLLIYEAAQAVLIAEGVPAGQRALLYILRLVAFGTIAAAIIHKNAQRKSGKAAPSRAPADSPKSEN